MRIKISLALILVLSILVNACDKPNADKRTEVLEIYSSKGNGLEKTIDSLRFFESTEYINDRKKSTSYFDNTGELTGKEVLIYDKEGRLISGTYFDPNGKVLSTYDYITDEDDRLIAEYGFDGQSQELLSIKAFEYDAYDRIVTQRVFESDYTLYRKYDFVFDSNGNEKSMAVFNGEGEQLLFEDFKIVAKDSSDLWTEKWGFINDVPVTFYKKS